MMGSESISFGGVIFLSFFSFSLSLSLFFFPSFLENKREREKEKVLTGGIQDGDLTHDKLRRPSLAA